MAVNRVPKRWVRISGLRRPNVALKSARVKGLHGFAAHAQTFFIGEPRELLRIVLIGPAGHVCGHEHALRRSKSVRGIDDIFIGTVGPREAAENIVVTFPEARCFERDFHARQVIDRFKSRLLGRRKIV